MIDEESRNFMDRHFVGPNEKDITIHLIGELKSLGFDASIGKKLAVNITMLGMYDYEEADKWDLNEANEVIRVIPEEITGFNCFCINLAVSSEIEGHYRTLESGVWNKEIENPKVKGFYKSLISVLQAKNDEANVKYDLNYQVQLTITVFSEESLPLGVKPLFMPIDFVAYEEELKKFIPNVHNQATTWKEEDEKKIYIQNNMRYRSREEVFIAVILDWKGILYMPNCRARVGPGDNRINMEPDFLIIYEGCPAILQLDGRSHNSNTRAKEQEQDRQYHDHHIKTIQHYGDVTTLEDAKRVVNDFLHRVRIDYGLKN